MHTLLHTTGTGTSRAWLTDSLVRLAVDHLDMIAPPGLDSTVAAVLASAAVYAILHAAGCALAAARRWRTSRRQSGPQPAAPTAGRSCGARGSGRPRP